MKPPQEQLAIQSERPWKNCVHASDPVELMNAVCRWKDPPPRDTQWELALARACDTAIYWKKRFERLSARKLSDQKGKNDALTSKR